jgi:hypothetical protein
MADAPTTPTPTVKPMITVGAGGAKPAPLSPSGSAPKMIQSAPPFKIGSSAGVGRYLKLLAYGQAGRGKTELVASAADVESMQGILFIDCEKGDMTIQENPRIKNWDSLMQNRVEVNSFMAVAKIHDWLKGHVKARDANNVDRLRQEQSRMTGVPVEEIDEPIRYKTVIIDSLTEVNMYSTYELLGVTEAKVLDGGSDEVDVAGWDEFRKNNQRIQMLLRAFRDLPMHVLVTAGEQYKQDEMKKFYYEPSVTGQLARQVQGFFDIVGHFQVHKKGEISERRLYVQPTGNFNAKNRRSVFKGDYFTNPNMAMIMKETGLVK